MLLLVWFGLALVCASASGQVTNKSVSEGQLKALLAEYNANLIPYCNRVQQTQWNVATDVGKKDKEDANVSVFDVRVAGNGTVSQKFNPLSRIYD